MKRKKLAMFLAAALTVTGTANTAAISAAEFSETEIFSFEGSDTDEASHTEESDTPEIWEENAAEPSEEAPEEDVEIFEETVSSAENESTAEETPLFSDNEAEAVFTDEEVLLAEETEYRAHFEGGYVTEEQFKHWTETGEEPEDWVQVAFYDELATADELLAKMKEVGLNNTGYLMISRANDEAEGFWDLTAPAGTAVGLTGGAGHKLRSIKADSEVTVRGDFIETPGVLEINGSVTIADNTIDGEIKGTGSNDTLILDGEWNHIGGLRGVEKLVFSENRSALEIDRGYVEFFGIQSLGNKEDHNVCINIQGYSANNLPVFHQDFDLGMNHDEEGNSWPAGLGITYVKNFEVPEGQDWVNIIPKDGSPVVRFDCKNNADRVRLINKMWVNGNERGHGIDFDGALFTSSDKFQNFYYIVKFVSAEGTSARDAFFRYGVEDYPEQCRQDICMSRNLKNVYDIMNALTQESEGYYIVGLPGNVTISETLTVPSAVNGIKYEVSGNYDEATDTWTPYPVKISSISTPKGKVLALMNHCSSGGTLNITGEGETSLMHCRLNQNVNATHVNLSDCSIKSLVCDTLFAAYDNLRIGEYLKFNEAVLPEMDIFAKAGADLHLGQINNGAISGSIAINMESRNGKTGTIYVDKGFNLGTGVNEEGDTLEHEFRVRYIDYERSVKAGTKFSQNIYNFDYDFWGEDESLHIWNYLCKYKDEAKALLILSKEATVALDGKFWNYCFEYLDEYELRPVDMTLESGKRSLASYPSEEGEVPVLSKAYIKLNGAAPVHKLDLQEASITLKDQVYTGKALKPAATVKLNGKTLKSGTDYTITYKNNTKIGTATAVLTGKGNYKGTIQKTFKILPKNGTVSTVGALKYKITKTAASNGTVTVTAPAKTTSTSLTIPATVKIKGYTFKVTAIGDKAFRNNAKLKNITIGTGISSIGKEAFYGCKALKTITVKGTSLTKVGTNALKGIYAKAVIKVPASKLTAYTKLFKSKGQSKTVKISK